jgi:hypothetical protein
VTSQNFIYSEKPFATIEKPLFDLSAAKISFLYEAILKLMQSQKYILEAKYYYKRRISRIQAFNNYKNQLQTFGMVMK